MSEFRCRKRAYASKYSKLYRAGHRLTLPATGTRRRIQGLRYIGYTTKDIAEGTGLSETFLGRVSSQRQVRIGLSSHRLIVAFYDEHSHKPVDNHKATKWAKKLGFAPPMAWNDIDDPSEHPKGVLQ